MSSQAIGANSQKCLNKKNIYMDFIKQTFCPLCKTSLSSHGPSKREIPLIHIFMANNQSEKLE